MAMATHQILVTIGVLVLGCNAERSASYASVQANHSFSAYMAAFGKQHMKGTAEYWMRENIFQQRLAELVAHNSAGHHWKMGLNEFTDWTEGELTSLRGYKKEHTGYSTPASMMEVHNHDHDDEKPAEKPENQPAGMTEAMDWTSSLATSKEVFNQGPCGSCWAVATAAAIQLHAAKEYPNFKKILSPENINKCAPNPMQCGGDGGCKGSTPKLALTFLAGLGRNGGLYPMDALPYTASTGSKIPEDVCSNNGDISFLQMKAANNLRTSAAPSVSIGGWEQVETNNAAKVMDALVTKGPLAVAVVGSGIQGYSSGVIDKCASTVVDHAVVLMGYGNDKIPYWKIRNSWGTGWGEEGFFRLQRHTKPPTGSTSTASTSVLQTDEEPCAWDNDPAKGVACKDEHGKYPEKTRVCGQCGILSDVLYPTDVKVHSALLG